MKYLSVCSGIEAASAAWHCLGWEPLAFSEIEPFPRAVLTHHYPGVPLHGDFTKLRDEPWIVDADILVGGTPCQAFSVAGLRNSLADDRGNLTLEFVRLADAIDDLRHAARKPGGVIVWENVPGVLSVKDNAFGCFLAALAGDAAPYDPTRGKWTNAGVVDGPQRTVAWRVLDAQYFGLAQRRRRVFVVASARAGFDPAAVLLEFEGLRRDTPPRREAWKDPTAHAASGTDERRSHWDGREYPHPTLNQSFNTGAIGYSNQELFSQRGAGLVGEASTGEISHCLNAGGMGRQDYETETLVTHALRGEGFDASEDGTGRGTPLVPVAYRTTGNDGVYETGDLVHALTTATDPNSHVLTQPVAIPMQEVGKRTGTSTTDPRAGIGIGEDGDPMYTLQAGAQHGVATAIPFDTTQITSPANYSKPNDGDPCHPLAAGAHPPAVAYAFQSRIARNGRGDMGDLVNALNAQSGETGKGDAAPCVATINHGDHYADAAKAGPIEALRALRREIGEEAFTVWGFGSLAAFQSPEILQSALHGCGLRPAPFSRSWMVHCALSRPEDGSAWLLQSLRETGCAGCPPPGWEPSEQLAGELGAYLSKLSQPGASAESVMRDLWLASEGPGVLQQALAAVQAVGRSVGREGQPTHATMAVRRLTATECEFLQGFPRNYTLIPWKKKPAADCPDGPRYKALGNSMAVPVMRWIGRQIAAELTRASQSEKDAAA